MKKTVTRRAILIGCPGGIRNKPLQGVKCDLPNFREFLTSPRSGCFYKEEIITLDNPTLKEVIDVINETSSDYSMVYFSGHGSYNTALDTQMLSLKDCDISLSYFNTNSRIQLVVIDACRDFVPEISGIPEQLGYPDYYDVPFRARERFDEYIENANSGYLVVFSTQIGTSSWDTHHGGFFTTAFLNVANQIKTKTEFSPLFIDELLPFVKNRMEKNGVWDQTPKYFSTDNYNMPVVLGNPYEEASVIEPETSPTNKKSDDNSVPKLITAGLVLFAIHALFND